MTVEAAADARAMNEKLPAYAIVRVESFPVQPASVESRVTVKRVMWGHR
jgi:hypothetical protein